MVAQRQPRWTAEQYLAMDASSAERHEYLDGQVLAMTGGSRNHSIITLNTGSLLNRLLDGGPCQAYSPDMRVQAARQAYFYPDVTVACGEQRFSGAREETLLNPTLIVEVLSESTEAFDRGRKFEAYQRLASLKQYVLIAQDRARVECFTRQADGLWLLHHADGLEAEIRLESVGVALRLAEIYRHVTLEDEPPG